MSKHYVVTLGTAGGPRLWKATAGPRRFGISTAVVVDDAVYVVDFGRGALTQFQEAGLDYSQVKAAFITHLHSDHTVDLMNWLLIGWVISVGVNEQMQIFGPGDRGKLVPLNHNAEAEPPVAFPDEPVNGTEALVHHIWAGSSADVNERMRDSLYKSPTERFAAHDIAIPAEVGFDANEANAPAMEPFVVYEDEHVSVSAILVDHKPMAPAFAFRFDTRDGHSVAISGDTTKTENMVRIARGTDLLIHEAIDMDWVAERGKEMDDPLNAKASVEHHKKAHTTPQDAGWVAQQAGAKALALNHLVPGHARPQVFAAASETFDGPVLVPSDLDIIEF